MSTTGFLVGIAATFVFAVALAFKRIRKQGSAAADAIILGWVLGFTSLILVSHAWAVKTGNLIGS